MISRAAQHAPLIAQEIEQLRNEHYLTNQTVNQLRSVRGRRSELQRQQMTAAEQLEIQARHALAIALRQLDQVRNIRQFFFIFLICYLLGIVIF